MSKKQTSTNDQHENALLKLHKEEIHIQKKQVETADVTVYKRSFTEVKEIMVPVTHEELIIEKKTVSPDGATDGQFETIRIPLSEERIEVTLHPTVLEEVEMDKNRFEEIIQVHENLKEEKLHIDTVGDIKVTIDD